MRNAPPVRASAPPAARAAPRTLDVQHVVAPDMQAKQVHDVEKVVESALQKWSSSRSTDPEVKRLEAELATTRIVQAKASGNLEAQAHVSACCAHAWKMHVHSACEMMLNSVCMYVVEQIEKIQEELQLAKQRAAKLEAQAELAVALQEKDKELLVAKVDKARYQGMEEARTKQASAAELATFHRDQARMVSL